MSNIYWSHLLNFYLITFVTLAYKLQGEHSISLPNYTIFRYTEHRGQKHALYRITIFTDKQWRKSLGYSIN